MHHNRTKLLYNQFQLPPKKRFTDRHVGKVINRKERECLHWVAAEPPSDGLRCATWSTEIRSASTVFTAHTEKSESRTLDDIT